MMLRVLLIDGEDPALAAVGERLAQEPAVSVERRVVAIVDADVALRSATGPVLAIVGVTSGDDADAAFRLVEELKPQMPNVHWLFASADRNPQTILRALRAGADEFLPLPLADPELLECLARVRRRMAAHEQNGASTGRIVSVFSAQGGVGCTTIATNLAISLAGRGHSVVIVDLVLQFGSVTSFLDLSPSFTIVDFAEKLERFDPMLLEGSLAEHSSGVRTLAEPFRAEDASRISATEVTRILDTLARSFEFVIVDMPKEMDDARFPAFEKSHLILFPIELNVPSMRRAQRALQLFERFGVSLSKVGLIVNRFLNDRVLGLDAVEATLGRPSIWTLPNDYVTAQGAINQGVPVVQMNPGGLLAQSYEGLTQKVLEEVGVAVRNQRPNGRSSKLGILSRWVQGGRSAIGA